MTRRRVSLVLNALISITALAAWAQMAFRFGEGGALSASGLRSLKYFTVLSNLLQGLASAVYAFCLARRLRGRGGALPAPVRLLKYAGTVSVALTFATVMCFLGPVFGYSGMFAGASFWMHLVVPLAAAFDFCVLDREGRVPFRASFVAVVPMLLYAAGYIANLLINGVGEWPHTNDWYGFVRGGVIGTAGIVAAMILATWALALLLRLPRRGGTYQPD